ncbi:hypothetical protein C8046_06420 [Serinibacter arcticus]|uniref:Uncharacterized protein n=1 Tax=Serinibacter arcticus TaxID=1655435 RepID=A0A2U1ZTS9_9MICO|nr:hypothetical protein [Serinibacter arcticus]PWD50343.1 hypothetical protein C8046_06420 [Serinibacter arcticus]
MSRHHLTLSAARPALAAVGLGERAVPDPALVEAPPQPVGRLDREAPLLAVQKRLAHAPLRGGRVGVLRWNGDPVKQGPTSCGAMSLLLLAAAGDPVLAAWLTTGVRVGTSPPSELSRASREDLEAPTVAGRIAVAERLLFARARERAIGPVTWPAAIGTPPWTAAREARFRGVRFSHTAVHDVDVARTRAVLSTVARATALGIPVPLYTGGDVAKGITTAIPRHVVLAVPSAHPKPGELRIYEPGGGRIHSVGIEQLLARRRTHPALGYWTHVTWALLPESAFGR